MDARPLPGIDDVHNAAARIRDHVRRTPVLRCASLDALAGCELHFKCENLQRSGSFKFRGACNAVFLLAADAAARGVVTQSSGNHGAAVARACRIRGVAATVVVPAGASPVKLAAIEREGAAIVRCAATQAARDEATARIQRDTGASLVHPFDDAAVIAGQGTATLELHEQAGAFDCIVAPVSGGGLLSGTAITSHALAPRADVYGAEPTGADDANVSLARGERQTGRRVDTICDALRAELGSLAFAILHRRARVLLAPDSASIAAMRLLLERMKLLVEPSSALALAVVLAHPRDFAGKRVAVILSGGNVDLDALPWVPARADRPHHPGLGPA